MRSFPGVAMNPFRLMAALLILGGVAGLAYGELGYTEDTHTARVGDLAVTIREQRTVNVPLWAGMGAILAGTLVLAASGQPRRA